MSWTPEVVRARFVEACDTARRLPKVGGPSDKGGFWPAFMNTYEDELGWGTVRLAEKRQMFARRLPPSSAAITRHDEVMTWTAEYIEDETRRRIVWGWAWCRLSGASFAERCRENGWVRLTAYRRLSTTIDCIVHRLHTERVLKREPDQRFLLQEEPSMPCVDGTLETSDTQRSPSQTAVIFDGPRPRDMLTTPKAVEDFSRFLEKTNKARRHEQERRKRKLLGLEENAA